MPLRCPVCKAENSVGPACRRCKADLGMLFAMEEQRSYQLAEAQRALATNRVSDGLKHATTANNLRNRDDSEKLLALLNLLSGNLGEAWRAYQSTGQHG